MTDLTDMEALARASLYIPELARGIEGEVIMEVDDWSGREEFDRVRNEIREAQIALYQAGWRQDKRKARLAPRSHNYEIAVYKKQFKPGKKSRWITVEVTVRFGLRARFVGMEKLGWD